MNPSPRRTPAAGFVNRWSGVQFSHPAPQQNQHYPDGAGLFASSARPESGESAESNVDLPYRKSGHTAPAGHVIDQRLEIPPLRLDGGEKRLRWRDFLNDEAGGAGHKSGHSDPGLVRPIVLSLAASIVAVFLACAIVVGVRVGLPVPAPDIGNLRLEGVR